MSAPSAVKAVTGAGNSLWSRLTGTKPNPLSSAPRHNNTTVKKNSGFKPTVVQTNPMFAPVRSSSPAPSDPGSPKNNVQPLVEEQQKPGGIFSLGGGKRRRHRKTRKAKKAKKTRKHRR